MSNVIGNNLKLTLFGESHGEYIGATLSSLPSGIKIDLDYIKNELVKRKPSNEGETSRVEDDEFNIISGVYNGFTTGSPLTLLMKNKCHNSSDYDDICNVFRPSHADYTAHVKYDGFNDPRGGGHFSGRLTAPIVAVCAILKKALEDKNIIIGSHVKQIGNIEDFNVDINVESISKLNKMDFPLFNENLNNDLVTLIKNIRENGDSIGGKIETFVLNLDAGLGEPFFDSLESQLSHAVFSIPAIKGVAFGLGEDYVNSLGSEVNDSFTFDGSKVVTTTNNNGGINGGISNGMPLVFSSVIKPTPSIFKTQKTLNKQNKQQELCIKGRHDSCLVRRIIPVINALTAFVIFDNYISLKGINFLK